MFSTRARNVAARGLLVMMAAELEVGEPVEITYSVEGQDVQYHDVKGTIVRVGLNRGEGKEEWPYLAAVEFSGTIPNLEILLGDSPVEAESDESEASPELAPPPTDDPDDDSSESV